MVKPSPASALEMSEADLLFQLEIVSLNAPSKFLSYVLGAKLPWKSPYRLGRLPILQGGRHDRAWERNNARIIILDRNSRFIRVVGAGDGPKSVVCGT